MNFGIKRRDLNVLWSNDLSKEIRVIANDALTKYGCILPSWLEKLIVEYKGDIPSIAEVGVDYVYREATVTLGGKFIQCDEIERGQTIVHEFCHIVMNPLYSEAIRLKNFAVDGSESRYDKYIKDTVAKGNETTVEDLSRIIWGILNATD